MMTYAHARNQGQRPVGSKARLETDGHDRAHYTFPANAVDNEAATLTTIQQRSHSGCQTRVVFVLDGSLRSMISEHCGYCVGC